MRNVGNDGASTSTQEPSAVTAVESSSTFSVPDQVAEPGEGTARPAPPR